MNASADTATCGQGMRLRGVVEMLFGRNIGDAVAAVSEANWARFLDEEITPRFPDGLTVTDASGQWRDAKTGRIVREPAKLVIIVLMREPEQRRHIGAIVADYKSQFNQQSVLTMTRRACVAF